MRLRESGRLRAAASSGLFDALFWLPLLLTPAAVDGRDVLERIVLGVLMAIVLAALVDMAGSRRRYFYLLAGIVLALGAAIWIGFASVTRIELNPYVLITAATYATDARSFTYVPLNSALIYAIPAILLPFVMLAICWRSLDWTPSRLRWIAGAAAIAVIFPLKGPIESLYGQNDPQRHLDSVPPMPGQFRDGQWAWSNAHSKFVYPFNEILPLKSYWEGLRYLQFRRAIAEQRFIVPSGVHSASGKLTLVVIVGESTGRRHMHLYGYCRKTTPRLDALKGQLNVFSDLISQIPLTIFALTHTLIMKNAGRDGQDTTVIETLNAAHFDTWWISNQLEYGVRLDPLTVVASAARHQSWTYRLVRDGGHSKTTPDDVMLAPFQKALRDPAPRKAIFLHQFGAHFAYSERYPAAFARGVRLEPISGRTEGETRLIDEYDTAVRYTDAFVGQIIADSAKSGQNVIVVYFSDHGEEVFDDIDWDGHRFPAATRSMVEVPLVVWVSPTAQRSHWQLVRDLRMASVRRLTMDNLTPLLLSLTQTKVPWLQPERDPLSSRFLQGPRLVDGHDYDRDRKTDVVPVLTPARCDPVAAAAASASSKKMPSP